MHWLRVNTMGYFHSTRVLNTLFIMRFTKEKVCLIRRWNYWHKKENFRKLIRRHYEIRWVSFSVSYFNPMTYSYTSIRALDVRIKPKSISWFTFRRRKNDLKWNKRCGRIVKSLMENEKGSILDIPWNYNTNRNNMQKKTLLYVRLIDFWLIGLAGQPLLKMLNYFEVMLNIF